jgi:hypothetical protein
MKESELELEVLKIEESESESELESELLCTDSTALLPSMPSSPMHYFPDVYQLQFCMDYHLPMHATCSTHFITFDLIILLILDEAYKL